MIHRFMTLFAILVVAILFAGCAVNDGSTIVPSPPNDKPAQTQMSQTHLWGYYDISIDVETLEVTAVPDRAAMFTANVVNFINSKPTNLGFHINGVTQGSGYTDIDIDITITHPFPGLPQYNGYDVRGVFMGNGTGNMAYNTDLFYPVDGTDQMMLADPVDGYGGPDGYSRWFNKAEFSEGGMPLFQYTQGKSASPGFDGTATLNPYKYFANGLGATDNLWTWLAAHPLQNGKFTSGASNTRNYYLRFPTGSGIKYGYAITANWGGPAPENHPSNAPEAVACKVTDTSNVYYVSPSSNGGKIKLDISIWDWDSVVGASGVMEDYRIYVESTVLANVYQFDTDDMTPVGGNANYSTYHVEIPADNVTGVEGNEYWVIMEEQGADYTNELGVPNLANTDPLAAFYRFALNVGNTADNTPPVINGITDDIVPDGLNTTLDETTGLVTYIVDYTDPDVGQTHTIKWYIEDASATAPSDPNDAMPFDWAPKPAGDYKIWVKVSDGIAEAIGGPYAVTKTVEVIQGWARTWGASLNWDQGWDLAVDASGNIYVSGTFKGTVDFDPGPDIVNRSSNGSNFDCFMSKFTPTGVFVWARTWGGTNEDWAKSVVISGNYLYVSGYFRTTMDTEQVDFDPDPLKTSLKASNGDRDSFVSQFDLNGTFNWVQTWGTSNYEWGGESLAADPAGNVYVLGWVEQPFSWKIDLRSYTPSGTQQWAHTWPSSGAGVVRMEDIVINGSFLYFTGLISGTNIDMDPGAPVVPITALNGDAILCCFNTSGTFQWIKNWGAASPIEVWATSIACDPSGNIYIGGPFVGVNVDFDPGSGYYPLSSSDGGNNRDCFLTKFNSSGEHQWAKAWGGTHEDWVRGVATDSAGNVYVSGYYRSASCNLDPDGSDYRANAGGTDVFVSRFDTTGDYIWGRNIGGGSWDYGTQVLVNGNKVFFTGAFSSYDMDFDPGPGVYPQSTKGYEDVFLSLISTNGSW